MNSRPPKFRSDLECRPQETATGTVFVVKDPVSGDFFRLRENERFIVDQLDGDTSLDIVRHRAEKRFATRVSPDVLAGFVRHLDDSGLLESGPSDRSSRRRGRPRFAGGPLNFRIRLIDPEPLLRKTIDWVRFLFTPAFVTLSALAIAAAALVCVFEWSLLAREAAPFVRLGSVPWVLAALFVVVSLHEFAHAMTCKHFGGQVREMGFLLLYFQPALYCDVSDAWLFPKKSRRLWVGMAGPYFELFLWALAVLAWRTTDPGALVHQASLVVIAASGFKTLLNFNPLLKLDGYYLLSDWLDIPNLRRKSFRYTGEYLKRFGGLGGPLPEATPRERRIFLAYGLCAWIFSVSILAVLGAVVGPFLIVEGYWLAFMAFAGFLGWRFRNRLGKPFRRSSSESESSRPRRPLPGAVRRRFFRLAAASAVALFLFGVRMELRVTGPVTVLPRHNADVRAEIDGVVEEILIAEGQRVEKGDLVARLSGRDVRAELRKTEAEIQQVEARLDQLKAGPRAEEIEVARIVVVRAQDRLAFAKAKRKRIESQYLAEVEGARGIVAGAKNRLAFAKSKRERSEALHREKLMSLDEFEAFRQVETVALNEVTEAEGRLTLLLVVSQNELETAREAETDAHNELTDGRNRFQLLQAGTRPEEIRAADAERGRLEAHRDYLKGQLERLDLRSPASGIVTTPRRQLEGLVRQAVSKGGLIAKVHELRTVTVEAAIPEKEIADVKDGQNAAIKVRAFPDRVFHGWVREIAPTAQPAGASDSAGGGSPDPAAPAGADANGTMVRVLMEIDNSLGLLKPGMTGMMKIECGDRLAADLLVRRLSRTFRVEFWSWW